MTHSKSTKKEISKQISKGQLRKELLRELIPLAKSFGLWILLVIIVAWDYTNTRWFSMIFIDLTTYLSFGLAKLLHIPAVLTGEGIDHIAKLEINYRNITIDNFPMVIELECSAYHAYLAIIALVIFSKWTLMQKLTSGSILFALLSIINALRIVLLGVAGNNSLKIFNLMHDYIWNILLVVVIWAMWEFTNKKLGQKRNLHEELS